MLHDGMIHWFGHGQQASLSVTYVEALCKEELEHIRNLSEYLFIHQKCRAIFPYRPECATQEAQVSRWGGN